MREQIARTDSDQLLGEDKKSPDRPPGDKSVAYTERSHLPPPPGPPPDWPTGGGVQKEEEDERKRETKLHDETLYLISFSVNNL